MSDNIAKFVTIIEANVNSSDNNNRDDDDGRSASPTSDTTPPTASIRRLAPSSNFPPPEDFFFPSPTFSERFMRILMVAIYLCGLCSLGFILSVYHIFFWDSRMPPVHKKKIAIRLLNSSEVTAEQFYKHILEQYRILNQLQQQRQQFLQKQHIQLQQLAAGNKFQEIFATATIIQSNPNDRINKPITPTNGTFLLAQTQPPPPQPPQHPLLMTATAPTSSQASHAKSQPIVIDDIEQQQQQQLETEVETEAEQQDIIPRLPILDTLPAIVTHIKRKTHRKHNRHNTRSKYHKKLTTTSSNAMDNEHEGQPFMETPLNPPTLLVQESIAAATSYTPMPMAIPLILNSKEEKHPHHTHADKKSANAFTRKRTSTSATGYDAQSYLNPFLTGELIFEK